MEKLDCLFIGSVTKPFVRENGRLFCFDFAIEAIVAIATITSIASIGND